MWTRFLLFSAVFVGFFLLSPACWLKPPADVTQNAVCLAPPTEFANGYLQQCLKNEGYFCCAYGYVKYNNNLCYHILCQAADSCGEEWQYKGTECPAPQEAPSGKVESQQTEIEG